MTIRQLTAVAMFLSLAAWLAAIFAATMTAAAVFAQLGQLDVVMPEAAALDAGDRARYIGGFITQPVFAMTDAMQIGCAIVVLATSAITLATTGTGRRWQMTSLVTAGIAAGLLVIRLTFWTRPFDDALSQARRAVADGDLETYAAQAAVMHDLHPTLVAMVAAALLAVIVSIVSASAATAGKGIRSNGDTLQEGL